MRDAAASAQGAAGGVSLLTGESSSAGIIAAMVLLSVALDQVQQTRAETAAQRLSETVALRGGQKTNEALRSKHARIPVAIDEGQPPVPGGRYCDGIPNCFHCS